LSGSDEQYTVSGLVVDILEKNTIPQVEKVHLYYGKNAPKSVFKKGRFPQFQYLQFVWEEKCLLGLLAARWGFSAVEALSTGNFGFDFSIHYL
jgi:hypothetical protein